MALGGNVKVDMDSLQMHVDTSSPTYSDLEGDIGGGTGNSGKPGLDKDFDTLDEPVTDTVKRDLKAVALKFGHVLYPKSSQTLLKEWDLWGPLFICVFMSLLLQGPGKDSKGPQFTEVFFLTFFGACVVTLNIKLLGGTISFFQSLCVLGYCLFPPAVAALVTKIILLAGEPTTIKFFLRLVITVVGFVWATYASTAFLSGTQPRHRKALVIYPIFLFYTVISWLIISHTHYGHN